jgi:hypothetical protein
LLFSIPSSMPITRCAQRKHSFTTDINDHPHPVFPNIYIFGCTSLLLLNCQQVENPSNHIRKRTFSRSKSPVWRFFRYRYF